MSRNANSRTAAAFFVAVALVVGAGGCMVGPNYKPPEAPVAESFRDPKSDAVTQGTTDLTSWWTTFEDPTLNELVKVVHERNPTLQVAAVRVIEAQARRGIAAGLMFPQQQNAFGGYTKNQISSNQANFPGGATKTFDDFQLGAAAAWELDVWGRFRRGIEATDADVLAAVATYDDALVSLTGEVATEYVSIRILQERLAVTRANVEVQKRGLQIAETRFAGGTATELDRTQATVLLRDTEARIPDLEASIIQTQNRLCVLLGIPPKDLSEMLGDRAIPITPATVAVGIPADLLRRRPDIRRAERTLAAQSARIGVAKADLYPSFSLVGDIRLSSETFSSLFEGESVQAFGGPTFRWAIFNYGRVENNIRVEDARFQALIGAYEDIVLRAQSEVENSIAGYVGAGRQIGSLAESVKAAQRAVEVAEAQYRGGVADFTRVLTTQDALQTEQDRLVSARGAVALNLVSLYRAMGGGWELRSEKIPVTDKAKQQMRERTDWGKMLD
ncbi:MAG: efflux transporter outer membrane subunit [Phycisphaerae bacterium]|nr:efflux transporter outer membrane subunit [Tepidisphaeraceae bacterium]